MPETITRADLDQVAATANLAIEGVRAEFSDMGEIRSAIDNVNRRIDMLPAGRQAEPVTQFRSAGAILKAMVGGDETAQRDYEGVVSGQTYMPDSWVGKLVSIIERKRPLLSLFDRQPLPANGMGVEYAVLKADTTQAGVQAAEGDNLLFGKVVLENRTTAVKTVGGWTSLSRQVIERATLNHLDTAYRALAEKYGRASEAYVRAALKGAYDAVGAQALASVTVDLETQDGVIAAMLDLIEHYEEAGRTLDGILLDAASFKALYEVESSDRILNVSGADRNQVGTITLKAGSGEVAGIKFHLVPGFTTPFRMAYDQDALTVFEAAGVPFRLQDENVVNLTKDFSLYGYLAAAIQVPTGLVKLAS